MGIKSTIFSSLMAASASAQITTNIKPVPLYTANFKYQNTQLVNANGGIYAGLKGAPEGSFPIVCAPESRNASDSVIMQSSRVLCQNANDKSKNPEKKVLFVMWTKPGQAPAKAWELIGLADPNSVPIRSVSQFSWGPGAQMYLEKPEHKVEKGNQWFIAEHGQLLWSVNGDHISESTAITAKDRPHWTY